MKALGRRGFLGLLGATPLAGKMAIESAVKDLARMDPMLPSASIPLHNPPGAGATPIAEGNISHETIKRAFMDAVARGELESILFERERRVQSIDPDIAIHRSFSLAAKIAYQRQRNVAREVSGYLGEEAMDYWHNRLIRAVRKRMIGV